MRYFIAAVIAILPLTAQDIKFPASLDKLAEKAENVVDVTLGPSVLGIAGQFLSQKGDEAGAKKVIQGLKGIYVRSYEFSSPGQYSDSDVEEVRKQLNPKEWEKVVSVREKKGDNVEIYLKKEGDKTAGLTILAAEPEELTIVHIVGSINVEDIAKLGGTLGIPNVNMGPVKQPREN
jgi:hypothetical protein